MSKGKIHLIIEGRNFVKVLCGWVTAKKNGTKDIDKVTCDRCIKGIIDEKNVDRFE